MTTLTCRIQDFIVDSDHPVVGEDAPMDAASFGDLGALLGSDFHGRGGLETVFVSRVRVSATILARSLSNFDASSLLILRISSLMVS